MKVKEIKEKLIEIFGEKKGKEIYKKINFNLKSQNGETVSQCLKKKKRTSPLLFLFGRSFLWGATPEGSKYWSEIYIKISILL